MKEFEYVILNKLCNSTEYFNKAIPILQPKYFEDIGNQHVLKIIKEYYKEYKEVPSLTEVISKVKDIQSAEMRENIKTSLGAIYTVQESKNLDFIVNETLNYVKDQMYLEALRIGSDGLTNKSDELKLKAQQILDERAKLNIDSDLGLDFDDINVMIEYYSERGIGIRTQHKEFNKRLGVGFIPGTISLIMATAGIGKSLLMTDLISGMLKKGKNALLISLEMADKEIMKRVHANALDLPINSLIDLSRSPKELEKIKKDDPSHEFVSKEMILKSYEKMKSENKVGKLFVKDYPSGSFTPLMLESLIESYKLERGITFDIVFIDYVGIAKSDLVSPSVGLYSYIKSIVEEFRASAKKLKLPIISASQLNRGAVNNEDADNSSVSDSMGSVMTADWIVFLLQNEEMKARNELVAKCTKNRFNGRTDTWMMNVDYTRMRFSDMVHEGDMEAYVPPSEPVTEDFGIITAKKMDDAKDFADKEVKDIQNKAMEHLNDTDFQTPPKSDDPMDDFMKELGL